MTAPHLGPSLSHRARRPALLALSVCLGLLLIGLGESVFTQGAQNAARQTVWPPRLSGPAPGDVQVLPVQGSVHVIIGAGGNITVQSGDDGMLIVDSGQAAMTPKVLAALKTISTRPLRYIVNTTEFDEYIGGNSAIADTGEIIPFRAPDYTAGPQGALDITRASVISYYTLLHRVAGPAGKAPRIPEGGGRTTPTRFRRRGSTSTTSL